MRSPAFEISEGRISLQRSKLRSLFVASAQAAQLLDRTVVFQLRSDPTGHVRPICAIFGGATAVVLVPLFLVLSLAGAFHLDPVKFTSNAVSSVASTTGGAVAATASAAQSITSWGSGEDSSKASDMPAGMTSTMLALYQDAAKTCNMDWSVLAGVGWVETHHGQLDAPGVQSGSNSTGAKGPMQFLGSTWQRYGVDANGDGIADVYNPSDAIHGAAKYLCANGAGSPGGVRDALFDYNHSSTYVSEVMSVAESYRSGVWVLPIPAGTVSVSAVTKAHHDYAADDIAMPVGTQVFAVHGGTIATIDDASCGRGVVLDSPGSVRTTYCHLSSRSVHDGQTVSTGENIGLSGGESGSSGAGDSTGPHLHIQIEVNSVKVCPQSLLVAWSKGQFDQPSSGKTTGCSS